MHHYLLHHILHASTLNYPDNIAIVDNDQTLTYAELHFETERLASVLLEIGSHQGCRVGLMLEKSINAIIALLAILKTGAAYVPIDTAAPASRVNFIINNCKTELLLTSSRLARKIAPDIDPSTCLKTLATIDGSVEGKGDYPFKSIELNREICPASTRHLPEAHINDGSPAYILHTSGSTGVPKGVVVSHANALAFVNMAVDYFEVRPHDRMGCHAPLHFDLSIFDIFVALKAGASIILIPEQLSIFPIRLAQYIDATRITVWNSVASALSLLAERGQLGLMAFRELRLVIFSGDILPVRHLRTLMKTMSSARFFNVYGQTEANSSLCYEVTSIPDDEYWKIPIGKSFPNFEVIVLGEHNRCIEKPGDTGELYIGGPTVALGYLGDRLRTAEVFVSDPRYSDIDRRMYRTGDIVRLDENLDLVFLGRKDQQIKSRGYRIHLSEIENCIKKHSKVSEAVAVAVPDELFGNRLLSYVLLIDGEKISDIDILDFCNKFLPKYMIPEKIVFISQFPRTTTGKVDRQSLATASN